MTKILTISGSPVEGSSTEILLGRIERALVDTIGERVEVIADIVRLNDLKYIPCQSCGEAPETGFCLYDDNLADVYRQLESCDCLLFGSPIYFDTVSAQAK